MSKGGLHTPEMSKGGLHAHESTEGDPHAIYIYKVLKQVHPDTGVSFKAMSITNESTEEPLSLEPNSSPAQVLMLKFAKE